MPPTRRTRSSRCGPTPVAARAISRARPSQGQQRTGALALKLAELFYLQENIGEAPILLLDDVMSELDADRRRALLDFIRHEHIQTFITATDAAYFPAERMGTYRYVEAGTVREN